MCLSYKLAYKLAYKRNSKENLKDYLNIVAIVSAELFKMYKIFNKN